MINLDYTVKHRQIQRTQTVKTQIVLANTLCSLEDYFTKIVTRNGGLYDAVFTYTIGVDGIVYKHFDPKYYSRLFHTDVDSQIISIGLENLGWLKMILKTEIYDWKGCIYNGEVFEKCWRGKTHWATYTPAQVESLLDLLPILIKEHGVEPNFSGKNLTLDDPQGFKGVLNRSNYYKFYYDLSPAFDYEQIISKLKTI